MSRPSTVFLVGLGNIGSHLAALIARLRDLVGVLYLVDFDRYESANSLSQDIGPDAAGIQKADYQARRLLGLNPDLVVTALIDRFEALPLGLLGKADLIIGAVDSRTTRRAMSRAACRLGIPYLDGGVAGKERLSRVSTFIPGPAAPCIECSWGPADARSAEVRYPCDLRGANASPPGPPPTNAPASCGALTAALLALEVQKVLELLEPPAPGGRQIVLDALHFTFFSSCIPRNVRCPFDHAALPTRTNLPWRSGALTFGELFQEARAVLEDSSQLWLRVLEQPFVTRLSCLSGHSVQLFQLAARLEAADLQCKECGLAMAATAFDRLESLGSAEEFSRFFPAPLAGAGLRPLDILPISGPSGRVLFEIEEA